METTLHILLKSQVDHAGFHGEANADFWIENGIKGKKKIEDSGEYPRNNRLHLN